MLAFNSAADCGIDQFESLAARSPAARRPLAGRSPPARRPLAATRRPLAARSPPAHRPLASKFDDQREHLIAATGDALLLSLVAYKLIVWLIRCNAHVAIKRALLLLLMLLLLLLLLLLQLLFKAPRSKHWIY